MGAYQPTPPQSWSQIVEQTPGYGVTASSGGMTTPSTTVAGMSGYVAPPPGLTLPDFSSWRLLPSEPPTPSGGLTTAPPGLPGVGMSLMLRGAADRNSMAQMVQCPGDLAQWAQTQPTLVLHAPQMVPPLHQPLPGWLAMPYQQAVQPPRKSTGRGVTSDPSADKTAPVGSTSSQDHGRPTTRGQGDGGRSVSCPRGVQEKASV